jgi:LacI family transcriptional regulator
METDATPLPAGDVGDPPQRVGHSAFPLGKPPEKINIRDVAGEAGVSVATVSMVINNNPRISRATQGKVQRVIQRLGYKPSRPAQTLSGKYTQVIAVMLPALRHALADAYFGELLSGIADRAGRLNHKVLIEQAKPQFVKDNKHIELFERKYVDGFLCLGFNDKHHMLSDLSTRQYPVIMVDNRYAEHKLDWIHCDYSQGAEQAMNCLVQLGHRRIAIIYAAPESATARDVIDVYTRRMRELDSVSGEHTQWMADGMFTAEGGAAAAEKLLTEHPEITAILCGNDKMAIGAIHGLARLGIRVPEDVSVVGFDDIQHLPFVKPALTTVHLPLYELGSRAVDRLIERTHNKVEHVADILPTHLVLRESTAMVRTH